MIVAPVAISYLQPAQHPAVQKRIIAKQLVAKWNHLTPKECEVFEKLGDVAFEALWPTVQALLDRAPKSEADYSPLLASGADLNDAIRLLERVMEPKFTERILKEIHRRAPGWVGPRLLYGLLAPRKTTRSLTLPFFRDVLHRADPRASLGIGEREAQDYLRQVVPQELAAYQRRQLLDPKAHPDRRHQAFIELAQFGDSHSLKAVFATRDHSRKLAPLATWLQLDRLAPRVPTDSERGRTRFQVRAMEKDSQGRLWGLLGGEQDRWVARWTGNHWEGLTFVTMVPLDTSRPDLREQLTPPQDWLLRYIADSTLYQDCDGDGLSDVLEQHLGTDPLRADTDGDGLSDGQDKNPLAAPHPLTDEETIVVAAVEALFRFHEDTNLRYVILPPGIRPLELAGSNGMTIVSPSSKQPPIWAGATYLSFSLPRRTTQKTGWLIWSATHTEATFQINLNPGRLEGEGYSLQVKKLGHEWLVTKCELAWFS